MRSEARGSAPRYHAVAFWPSPEGGAAASSADAPAVYGSVDLTPAGHARDGRGSYTFGAPSLRGNKLREKLPQAP
ncbi:hypothetical protein L6255_01085 [Candidatus Parcubacteria bacterium]|nr:hypothetical protein [Candidatus Parcubacteria bacterium]